MVSLKQLTYLIYQSHISCQQLRLVGFLFPIDETKLF